MPSLCGIERAIQLRRKTKNEMKTYLVRRTGTNQLEVAVSKNGTVELTNRVTRSSGEITVLEEQTFRRQINKNGLRYAAKGIGRVTRA